MGLFKKFFKKNSIEEELKWQTAGAVKDDLNLSDPFVREQYVVSCLEQMKDASSEIDQINAEYSLVTAYLKDMEEIEALPEKDKSELDTIAKHIHELRKAHDKYVLEPSLISDHQYNHMETLEDDIPDGIKKLTAEEDYRGRVKGDLKRIDKERSAYNIRRHELEGAIENTRGIATIALVASAVLVVILFLLQVLLKLDVALGYYMAVIVVAVSITVIYLKHTDYVKEKEKVENTINELILLENKVKIRYVNNKNLLDYLYAKYEVESASELRDLYDRYVREKENRKAYERNEAVFEDETSRLLRKLRAQRIGYPEIWIHQSDAIYDNREMVEIRHNLIGRRQKLRKQLEYNEQIAIEASDEIKEVMKNYPDAAPALLDLVNKYGH